MVFFVSLCYTQSQTSVAFSIQDSCVISCQDNRQKDLLENGVGVKVNTNNI